MDLAPTLLQKIAKESGASPKQVASTLDLLEKRLAIPFIARYRKEAHGKPGRAQDSPHCGRPRPISGVAEETAGDSGQN